MSTAGTTQFIPVKSAAIRLGVPGAWLEREAREGRIPALRAGVRLLCDVEAVRDALRERTINDIEAE